MQSAGRPSCRRARRPAHSGRLRRTTPTTGWPTAPLTDRKPDRPGTLPIEGQATRVANRPTRRRTAVPDRSDRQNPGFYRIAPPA